MELSFGMGVLDMNKWARGGLIALGGLVALGIIGNLVAPPDDEAAVTATTNTVTATVTVGGWPFGVVFDGSNIWVANSDDATVPKIVP